MLKADSSPRFINMESMLVDDLTFNSILYLALSLN